MAVINTGHDIRERLSKPADNCTICGGCLGYPYLHWDGSGAGVDMDCYSSRPTYSGHAR
jgi:hypothetical protein